MHVFYLHGFLSSPRSSKAAWLAARLAGHGLPLHVPDLNAPDVATLTVSGMIAQAEQAVASWPPAPVVLIGSSLGGLVAWHVAGRAEQRGRPVHGLVLLAPAFDFGVARVSWLGEDELARWQATGWHVFHHHGYGEPRAIHHALLTDARRHDARAVHVSSPGIVFMGRRDEVVSPAMVAEFCAGRPNLRLVWLDDDHQLGASLERIWDGVRTVMGLAAPV